MVTTGAPTVLKSHFFSMIVGVGKVFVLQNQLPKRHQVYLWLLFFNNRSAVVTDGDNSFAQFESTAVKCVSPFIACWFWYERFIFFYFVGQGTASDNIYMEMLFQILLYVDTQVWIMPSEYAACYIKTFTFIHVISFLSMQK
jgi:hypothetical protein